LGKYLAQFYAGTGRSVKALDLLEYCISKNIWYPINPEHQTWKSIAQTKRFKKILNTFEEMKKTANKSAKPLYDVVTPPNYTKDKKYPLFIGFHQGSGTMEACKQYLTTEKIKTEFISAYIQSSQAYDSVGFTWNDLIHGSKDVKDMFDEIIDNYSVDTEKIILCGMSSGGAISLFLSLNNIIPSRGAIIFCPSKLEKLEDNIIQKAAKRSLKIVMVVGDQNSFYPDQQETEKLLRTNGLQIHYIVKQGMKGTLPDDYEEIIDSSLDYIFE
jgi:predicted esterase